MSSIIRIKRSSTAGSPSTLAVGELAYSAADHEAVAGGDRLYIGSGTETNGNASERIIIGGKYFTDMLDHAAGVNTAGSALIVDDQGKLDVIKTSNLTLSGTTIASDTGTTNVTGNLVVSGTVTGNISGNSETADRFSSPVTLDLGGEVDESDVQGTIQFDGSTSTVYGEIDLRAMPGITAGSYGSASEIPVLTVDSKGRVAAISTQTVATTIGFAGDSGSGTVDLIDETFTVEGGVGIDTVALDQTITISANSNDIKDIVGTMVDGVNEFGIAVTYDSTSKKLGFNTNDFVIALTGDVAGSATVTDLGNVTISTTVQPNSVALGTDTVGNFVSTVGAGSGITVTGSGAEGAAVTVGITATGVTPSTYGSATAIPTFAVNAQGQLTQAGAVPINANSFGTVTASDFDEYSWSATGSTSAATNAAELIVVSGNGIDVDIDTANNAIRVANTGVVTLVGDTHVTVTDDGATEHTISVDATPNNTASTIVARDASGGFSAGVIDAISLLAGNLAINGNTIGNSVQDEPVVIMPGSNGSVIIAADQTEVVGGLTINGDFTVTGTTTTTNLTELVIEDPLIHIASQNETGDTVDFGWIGHYSPDGGVTHEHAGMFRNAGDGKFYIFDQYLDEDLDSQTPSAADIDVLDPTFGTAHVVASTFEGDLEGNADSATKLATARTFSLQGDIAGSATFDGTGDATITATIQANSVALGADTTGNYVATVASNNSGILVSGSGTEGGSVTLALQTGSTVFTDGVEAQVANIIAAGSATNASLTYNATTDGIDLAVATATSSVLGVAKFSDENFSVTAGEVKVIEIDGGTY